MAEQPDHVDVEALARLREPFGPEHIGKLPRIVCPDCRESPSKVCDKHEKSKCTVCDQWITGQHIHLDYVGHGAVTHRLLDVDPLWDWEPLAFDQAGMPAFVYDKSGKHPVAFWIRLTVAGKTRLGVGTCEPGKADAEKILIGDCLRNAAMRFGVALDLWVKGHGEDDEQATAADDRPGAGRGWKAPPAPTLPEGREWTGPAKNRVVAAAGGDKDLAGQAWQAINPAVAVIDSDHKHVAADDVDLAIAEAQQLLNLAAGEAGAGTNGADQTGNAGGPGASGAQPPYPDPDTGQEF